MSVVVNSSWIENQAFLPAQPLAIADLLLVALTNCSRA